MIQPTAETLAGIKLFKGLPAEQRKEIARSCKAHRYEAKRQILSHADSSTDVYFLVSGEVRATIFSTSGKEVAFRELGPGDMFGEISSIDRKPRSASVVALVESIVISMRAEAFQGVLRQYPEVCMAALQELTDLVRLLSDRIVEMSTLGVKNRIHAELLRLAQKAIREDNTAVISPMPRHIDIASRVSTHREAVTRELNHLAHMNLVERKGSTLVIRDVARLQRIVEDVRSQHTG